MSYLSLLILFIAVGLILKYLKAAALPTPEPRPTPAPGQNRNPTLDQIQKLPIGLIVSHSPNPVRAQCLSQNDFQNNCTYTGFFETTVTAIDKPLTLVEFGAFSQHSGQWVFGTMSGKPFTNQDFAEWYNCPQGILVPGQSATDPQNWVGTNKLHSQLTLWYYIAQDDSGQRYRGQAIIELLDTPPDQ